MIPTFSEHRSAWFSLYLSAIHTGRTPAGAADFADEAVKLYADRYDALGKYERERDQALRRLSMRSLQVDVGVGAMLALTSIRKSLKEMIERKEISPWPFDLSDVDRILSQFHLIGHTYAIIPLQFAVPKEDDQENPLLSDESEGVR